MTSSPEFLTHKTDIINVLPSLRNSSFFFFFFFIFLSFTVGRVTRKTPKGGNYSRSCVPMAHSITGPSALSFFTSKFSFLIIFVVIITFSPGRSGPPASFFVLNCTCVCWNIRVDIKVTKKRAVRSVPLDGLTQPLSRPIVFRERIGKNMYKRRRRRRTLDVLRLTSDCFYLRFNAIRQQIFMPADGATTLHEEPPFLVFPL